MLDLKGQLLDETLWSVPFPAYTSEYNNQPHICTQSVPRLQILPGRLPHPWGTHRFSSIRSSSRFTIHQCIVKVGCWLMAANVGQYALLVIVGYCYYCWLLLFGWCWPIIRCCVPFQSSCSWDSMWTPFHLKPLPFGTAKKNGVATWASRRRQPNGWHPCSWAEACAAQHPKKVLVKHGSVIFVMPHFLG